ncbi:MAG: ISAzo13 family transposase, partial [Armatimonadetes bacterium]|nr:ISAzo13 family transposase [Armatimonadota bacterium]
VEHRLFSFITQNWRGCPLIRHEVVVILISATRTSTGLNVVCQLDTNTYPTGLKVRDAELAQVNLQPEAFHADWNYVIKPHQQD